MLSRAVNRRVLITAMRPRGHGGSVLPLTRRRTDVDEPPIAPPLPPLQPFPTINRGLTATVLPSVNTTTNTTTVNNARRSNEPLLRWKDDQDTQERPGNDASVAAVASPTITSVEAPPLMIPERNEEHTFPDVVVSENNQPTRNAQMPEVPTISPPVVVDPLLHDDDAWLVPLPEDDDEDDDWLLAVLFTPLFQREDCDRLFGLCPPMVSTTTSRVAVVAEKAHHQTPMAPRRPSSATTSRPSAQRSRTRPLQDSSVRNHNSPQQQQQQPLRRIQPGNSRSRRNAEPGASRPLVGITENLSQSSAEILPSLPQAGTVIHMLERRLHDELDLFLRREVGVGGYSQISQGIPELTMPLDNFMEERLMLRSRRH